MPVSHRFLSVKAQGRRSKPGIPGIVKLREVPLTALVVTRLTALPVPRGGEEVGGGGLIYRYSVPPGHHRTRARGTRQLPVPKRPELAGLGQVRVDYSQRIGQLCI